MKFGLIMLASGFGRRYGSNKLLADCNGQPLYMITLDKLEMLISREDVSSLVVVTQYDEIVLELQSRSIDYIINDHAEEGISSSFRLGISKTLEISKKSGIDRPDAIVSFVADQPYMKSETYERVLDTYVKLNSELSEKPYTQFKNEKVSAGSLNDVKAENELNLLPCDNHLMNGLILACSDGKHRGNPVIFDSVYIPELMQLKGDEGGKQIINRHKDRFHTCLVNEKELMDIDIPGKL